MTLDEFMVDWDAACEGGPWSVYAIIGCSQRESRCGEDFASGVGEQEEFSWSTEDRFFCSGVREAHAWHYSSTADGEYGVDDDYDYDHYVDEPDYDD